MYAVRMFGTCLLCTGQCVVPVNAVMHPWDAAMALSHYSHLLQEAPLCGRVLTGAYMCWFDAQLTSFTRTSLSHEPSI
jgi:hypothetical protein